MRYKLLGKSGLRVSELALGTMTFGTDWGWGADEKESRRQFQAFVEAGGNFIDTANGYTGGTSERFVGEFVADDRDRFVVATKYTFNTRPGDPNHGGNHRKNLRRSVRGSLERLGTDHIDLLWVHVWDPATPIEETMRALDDLVREGTVHYIGISDTPAWVVARANTLAEEKGWTPFVAYQGQWSLASRGIERDVVPMCEDLDLAITPWGVLAGGVLTGKYGSKKEEYDTRRSEDGGWPAEPHEVRIGETVCAVADEMDVSPSQVALAWLRQKTPRAIPIVAARKAEHIEDNLGVLGVRLSQEDMARLEKASGFQHDFPMRFVLYDNVRDGISGYTRADLDDHHTPVKDFWTRPGSPKVLEDERERDLEAK